MLIGKTVEHITSDFLVVLIAMFLLQASLLARWWKNFLPGIPSESMFNSELTTPVLFALLIYQMQEKVDNTNHPVKYLLLSNHSAHLSLEIVNVCRKYCNNLMILHPTLAMN